MIGEAILISAGWAASYFMWGKPRLWTNEPPEWEALIQDMVKGDPAEWSEANNYGRIRWRHDLSGILLEWAFHMPFDRWEATINGNKIPLSRASRLALIRYMEKGRKHEEARKSERAREEVARNIIRAERRP